MADEVIDQPACRGRVLEWVALVLGAIAAAATYPMVLMGVFFALALSDFEPEDRTEGVERLLSLLWLLVMVGGPLVFALLLVWWAHRRGASTLVTGAALLWGLALATVICFATWYFVWYLVAA